MTSWLFFDNWWDFVNKKLWCYNIVDEFVIARSVISRYEYSATSTKIEHSCYIDVTRATPRMWVVMCFLCVFWGNWPAYTWNLVVCALVQNVHGIILPIIRLPTIIIGCTTCSGLSWFVYWIIILVSLYIALDSYKMGLFHISFEQHHLYNWDRLTALIAIYSLCFDCNRRGKFIMHPNDMFQTIITVSTQRDPSSYFIMEYNAIWTILISPGNLNAKTTNIFILNTQIRIRYMHCVTEHI